MTEQRQIVLYFVGQTLSCPLLPGPDSSADAEPYWRKLLDAGLDAVAAERKVKLVIGPLTLLLTRSFLGYTIGARQESATDRLLRMQQQLIDHVDPDHDAPWREDD